MPRPNLPTGIPAEVVKPITKPGYLIELGFSPTMRFSSRGPQNWAGFFWISSGFQFKGSMLMLPGGDPALTSRIIAEGAADRSCRVWMFYSDTATDANTLLLFSGYIDGAPDLIENITLSLYSTSAKGLYAPRRKITRENGFSVLTAPGLRIQFGASTIELKADR